MDGKPQGATIVVQGPAALTGSGTATLPKTWRKVPPGTYTVSASLAGYITTPQEVQVQKDQTATVTFDMPYAIKWVSLPGGTFQMGNKYQQKEKPEHRVTIPPLQMTRTEVTVGQYKQCVDANQCTAPATGGACNWGQTGRGNHPVNCIKWIQAREFCTWTEGRLPSEAEWEYAARGGKTIPYPWGKAAPDCSRAVMSLGTEAASHGCGTGLSWAVCSKPKGNSSHSLCDMAGNVWEWMEDCWHSSYNGAPTDDKAWTTRCQRVQNNDMKVIRGGSVSCKAGSLRTAKRWFHSPARHQEIGLRCARKQAPAQNSAPSKAQGNLAP